MIFIFKMKFLLNVIGKPFINDTAQVILKNYV